MRDFDQGSDAIYLDAGDVLTAQEVFDIFSASATQAGRHVVFDNREGNILRLLDINLEDLGASDFYEINTEAEEEDMLIGLI